MDNHRINYRFESDRLQSYVDWPLNFLDPRKLVNSGFYYTGIGDSVKCFECGVVICQWVEGDSLMSDHRRWQSNCRFITKLPCGSVPIGVDPDMIPLGSSRSQNRYYGDEFRFDSWPDCHSNGPMIDLDCLARFKSPMYPKFASYESRLNSFESWPESMPETMDQLADAGFYYTGIGDQTLCYHCEGGLVSEDDLWGQHALWFKKCYYVLMVKGKPFINSVIGQSVTPPSHEEMIQMNLPSYIQKRESSSTSVEKNKDEISQVDSSTKSTDDGRICKICNNEELAVVFLPCGHLISCKRCAPNMTSCGVCRKPITMTVTAIIS